jgi:plasmid stabilization system protein ParE
MNAFRLSPEASQDLIEIYEYIAQDSVDAADRVREDLLAGVVLDCSLLSNHLYAWNVATGHSRCAARQT